jgi:hypothetical protein
LLSLNVADNAFNSDTMAGQLQYNTPDLPSMMGASIDDFFALEYINFKLGYVDP